MTYDITRRVQLCIDCIQSIPRGRRNHALLGLGSLAWTALEYSGKELEAFLSDINQRKCTPPLSEDEVANIALRAAERAEHDVGRKIGGIVCLDSDYISMNELQTLMDKISELPHVTSISISSRDIKSPHLREVFARMQAGFIDSAIGKLCPHIDETPADSDS